jgi:hypothetical protein
MSDHDMRTLLHDLADRPEPASTIDIAAARRSGKRRLWVQRGMISATVAAVVALAVAVPQTLFSAMGSSGAPAIVPAASGTVNPKTAPRSFNTLVPYAAFGYVPKGYEFQPTGSPSSGNTPFGFTSSQDELVLSVKQASGDGSIVLEVTSKGACTDAIDARYLDEIPGYWETRAHDAASCIAGVGTVGGAALKPAIRAPEMNGRAAYWLQGPVHEAFLAWQYAPDSWATLQAYPLDASSTTVAAQQAMLLQMAPTVKFGQAKPILFPFKLTSAIVQNWQAADVNYTVTSSGQYLATGLTEGQPYGGGAMGTANGDLGPVTIATSRTCPTPAAVLSSATGPVTTVQENGVSWRVENADQEKAGGKEVQTAGTAEIACTVGLVNGLHTSVALSQSGNSKPIINSILSKLTLCPTPQTWTANPLPS